MRTTLLVLAVGLLFALPAGADDFQDAAKLLKSGQHQQALERVNKILAAKPRDPQARFLKGLIFTEQGNSREAIDIFSKLTQDYPELPEPYNNLAVIYAQKGEYDSARVALETAVRTAPNWAVARENLGDIYARLAAAEYDRAAKLDRDNKTAPAKLTAVRSLFAASTPAKPKS